MGSTQQASWGCLQPADFSSLGCQLSQAPNSLMKSASSEALSFAYGNLGASTSSAILTVVYFQGVYSVLPVNTFSQVQSNAGKPLKIFVL